MQHRANSARTGTITSVSDKYPTWITVMWDNKMRGPKVVHRHELRLITDGKAEG